MESVSFARRFDNVTGSAIREIFKVLGRPGMISFAGGNPSLDALPDKLCADLARDALLADGKVRRLHNLKRKQFRHLERWGDSPLAEAISGGTIQDSEIRRALGKARAAKLTEEGNKAWQKMM